MYVVYTVGRSFLPKPKNPYSIVLGDSESIQLPQYEAFPIHDKVKHKEGYILNVGGSEGKQDDSVDIIPKLGIIAISFGCGLIGIFAVPRSKYIRDKLNLSNDIEAPLYIKFTNPLLTLSIPHVIFRTISWGGNQKIAAGCTNEILQAKFNNNIIDPEVTSPIQFFRAHDSCIRQVVWNSHNDPTHILSCGHDGRLQIIESRDPWMKNMFQRIRSFMMTACWPHHYGGIIFPDSENTVRYIRMDDLKKSTGIIMHYAPIWRISASYFHPFMASCSSDGSVKMTNICRLRDRQQKPIQVTLYRITYNKLTKIYTYWDNVKSTETTYTTVNVDNYNHFFQPEVSVQHVIWNPNFDSGTWIASGGSSDSQVNMNPAKKNKIDMDKLTEDEKRLFRMYGRLPTRKDILSHNSKERKYFDSGDYALSKAGKTIGPVGVQHPSPETIPHAISPTTHNSSPVKESSLVYEAEIEEKASDNGSEVESQSIKKNPFNVGDNTTSKSTDTSTTPTTTTPTTPNIPPTPNPTPNFSNSPTPSETES
ncbi:3448_t:CDS:10 [Entrophospora sp. SA101]|nr:3448_t:CDS:10 [Entrophospora sp. SA101]